MTSTTTQTGAQLTAALRSRLIPLTWASPAFAAAIADDLTAIASAHDDYRAAREALDELAARSGVSAMHIERDTGSTAYPPSVWTPIVEARFAMKAARRRYDKEIALLDANAARAVATPDVLAELSSCLRDSSDRLSAAIDAVGTERQIIASITDAVAISPKARDMVKTVRIGNAIRGDAPTDDAVAARAHAVARLFAGEVPA